MAYPEEPGRKTWAWLKEFWPQAAKHLYAVLYRHAPAYYLGLTKDGKPPVVLLPGITNRWSSMKRFADHVAHAGYPVYVIDELGNNTQLVPDAASIVHEFIAKKDLHDVLLLAHSKGGLVGKYYLMRENADKRVRGLVSVASPYGGSRPARMFPQKGFREMRENSPILRELSTDTVVNGRIISIYPSYDTHILIDGSSRLEGARENIEIQTGGHNSLLSNKAVIRKTLAALDELAE